MGKKNERIIQLLDEFQYLNRHTYLIKISMKGHLRFLCGTYHHVGASIIAPIIDLNLEMTEKELE